MSRFAPTKDDLEEMKHYRPKSEEQARRQVETIFAEQGWDETGCEYYLNAKLSSEGKTLDDLGEKDLYTVLAAMEERRLIIYQD